MRQKYRQVADDPKAGLHFHTGRPLAARLGYDSATVDALLDEAVESSAGVGNPFSLRRLERGEHVVDVGSGAQASTRSSTPAMWTPRVTSWAST